MQKFTIKGYTSEGKLIKHSVTSLEDVYGYFSFQMLQGVTIIKAWLKNETTQVSKQIHFTQHLNTGSSYYIGSDGIKRRTLSIQTSVYPIVEFKSDGSQVTHTLGLSYRP